MEDPCAYQRALDDYILCEFHNPVFPFYNRVFFLVYTHLGILVGLPTKKGLYKTLN